MTRVARYIIVLDRYDDDDWPRTDENPDGHNGTAEQACEQVAGEMQEAMDSSGSPAGFFNVIERRVIDPERAVTRVDADATASDLGVERRMENDPGVSDNPDVRAEGTT